ncbi:HD domain-containing phosphohydrolase [Cohnella caldifontis]|uniref:HD domain-containing phosphohydrolase n=1 Tax=Cohnella caldifontis TaxID=3027471 RepID=UPI0023ED1520|nr:HD domain-containing phosphohydrolase [Cohnella sp. YIM B05605]
MAKSSKDYEAFGEELQTLYAARQELQEAEYAGNALRPGYERLSARYEKLLREMNKVLRISDSQSLALLRMESELSVLLDNAMQGFLTVDRTLKVQKPYSAECRRIFGGKIGGASVTELMWPDDPDTRAKVERLMERMLSAQADESEVRYSDGLPNSFQRGGLRIRIDYKRIAMPEGTGDDPRIMLILTDITEQYKSKEQLEFLSTHDPLTGMFNRNYVEKWISDFGPGSPRPVSLIMADMNGLKLVNDVFGHLNGDQLLTRAGGIIRQTFGESAVCARWGGDEFLVLLPGADAEACAERIRRLREAFESADAAPIPISMAIGCATLADPGREEWGPLFQQAEKEMYKTKLLESRAIRKKLIAEITEAMYARGIEDRSHVSRLTALAEGLALRIGISPESPAMSTLALLAGLHDVGNIAIPQEVYRHDGPLAADQWDIVRTHSEIGYRLAFSLGEPALAEAILSVHENWDGSGYPYGLRGEQIPELSRLMAVVDAFDAMTHDRPHRPAMTRESALAEIRLGAGSKFDPRLAEVFAAWMSEPFVET